MTWAAPSRRRRRQRRPSRTRQHLRAIKHRRHPTPCPPSRPAPAPSTSMPAPRSLAGEAHPRPCCENSINNSFVTSKEVLKVPFEVLNGAVSSSSAKAGLKLQSPSRCSLGHRGAHEPVRSSSSRCPSRAPHGRFGAGASPPLTPSPAGHCSIASPLLRPNRHVPREETDASACIRRHQASALAPVISAGVPWRGARTSRPR